VPFPLADVEQSIPARFAKMARAHPHRLAVKVGGRAMSYAELDAAANQVAHAVLDRYGAGPAPVALLFEPGIALVVSLLGVLKAGKLYAPLDPGQPAARLQELIADLDTRVVLTDRAGLAQARAATGDGVAVLDAEAESASARAGDPGLAIPPDALAYVIFTSGSTGGAKGVMIDHREVLHYTMTYTNSAYYSAEDRHSFLNAVTTNAAASDIFPALLNGGAVLPYVVKSAGVDTLPAWLAAEGVTSYCSIPAIFRAWASRLPEGEFAPALRLIRLGGDQMLRGDAEIYQRRFAAGCIMRNGLGSAEALVIRHCFVDKETRLATHAVPVGYPAPDKEVVVLGDDGRPVPDGEVGEIAVRSRYMARGYWRDPALTAARFLDVPDAPGERLYLTGDLGRMGAGGCLVHLGRKDFQVKIRGKLIAPVEVENALLEMPSIREAAVVARPDRAGQASLVAYVVPQEPPGPADGTIRRALAATLSSEMQPATIVRMEALPHLANEKIDRRSLPEPPPVRPVLDTPFVAPRDPFEERVARAWAAVLGIDRVGVHDEFLDLGGDSLLATELAWRLGDDLGVEVSVAAALDTSTVASMARALLARHAGAIGLAIDRGDPRAL
jgi:amino acid adenylation domain-containing protein